MLSIDLTLNESSVFANIKFGFWQKGYLLVPKQKPTAKEVNKGKRKLNKKKKNSLFRISRKMNLVWKSFQIKKCEVVIDSGDMSLNAMLYPWFYLLSFKTGKRITINFQGENT